MKLTRAVLAGIGGAIVMSLAMLILRLAGLRVGLEYLLGSTVTTRGGSEQWIIGLLIHLAIGAFAGLAYAVVFEWAVQRSGPWVGAGLGLCHGLFAGLLMSSIPAMNPLELSIRVGSPGPFLDNLPLGPFIFVLLHILFGVCVGVLYGPTVQHEHLAATAPGRQV
jgi:hypothetical protein